MQEIVNCPGCQRKLQVPDTLLGQEVQCPTCSTNFVAATGGPLVPAPSPLDQQIAPPPPDYDRSRRREERPPRWDEEDDDHYDYRPDRRRRDLLPHRGGMILTFGILSLLGFCCQILFFFGPFAWVMGGSDLREIREGRMDPDGEGTTRAGWICGIIGTIFLILYVLGICVYVGLMAWISSNGGKF